MASKEAIQSAAAAYCAAVSAMDADAVAEAFGPRRRLQRPGRHAAPLWA
jgi:hypothetical protein